MNEPKKNCPDCGAPMRAMEGDRGDFLTPPMPPEWWCQDDNCGHTEIIDEDGELPHSIAMNNPPQDEGDR